MSYNVACIQTAISQLFKAHHYKKKLIQCLKGMNYAWRVLV